MLFLHVTFSLSGALAPLGLYERGQVHICAGFNGHGMPWCFGLARVMANRLEGTGISGTDEEDLACWRRCGLERFRLEMRGENFF